MRCTPTDSATVTTAGNPSGTAATARLTDVRSSSSHGVPRSHPMPKSTATMASAAQTRMRPTASSLTCSGVLASPAASVNKPAMRPSSVVIAVPTTMA